MDILPGVELTTAELEPGVLRVVNDGVLDLEWGRDLDQAPGLAAGPDGSVWATRDDGSLRLGDGSPQDKHLPWMDLEVAPVGTVWAMWLERASVDEKYRPATDAVFGYLDRGQRKTVDRWVQREGKNSRPTARPLVVTDAGEIWGFHRSGGTSLSRFADGSWGRWSLQT